MKKIIVICLCFIVIFAFAGCGAKELETENGTVYFENSADAYEAMTDAIENGEYENAEIFYNSGAADEGIDASDWYYYSLAKKEYEENGCIGYPIDLLENRLSYKFTAADDFIGELRSKARNLNGAYGNSEVTIYFADGKIAVSASAANEEYIFTVSELAIKNGRYYWMDRNPDGSHICQYEIKVVDEGINISTADENTDDLYSGTYSLLPDEIPMICY